VRPSRRQMIRLVLSHAGMAASGLGLLLSAAMAPRPASVEAEGDDATTDTVKVVASADPQELVLRAGPSFDQPIVAWLVPDESLMLLGTAHADGTSRWLPVRTAGDQIGWVLEQHVVAVTVPSPASSPAPEMALVEPPTLAPPPAPTPSVRSNQDGAPLPARSQAGRPVEIEAKLKYPEAKGRHQEITIWVTRDGAPVSGAIVTVFTENDDDEPLRVLEPTTADGRTRREFAIGRDKGSIELVVSAVAPDGGSARTTVSYFRR
jgi:hypothetical protein